jgi:AmpD protein
MQITIDAEGICPEALQRDSPHRDNRPEGSSVSLVVIHGISLPPGDFGGPYIDDLFLGRLDPQGHPYFRDVAPARVSSHFLVRRNGALIQYVPCAMRAWHAGESSWKGRSRCNDFSIGIELEGADDVPYAEPQYETLVALVRALFARYGALDVAGHSEIAPARKTDPGPYFDWSRVRAALGA